MSSLLDDTVARIETLLPGATCPFVELTIDPKSDESEQTGRADGNEVWLHVRDDRLHPTLVHELTHVALGPLWRRLPAAAEEGLCDVVAERLGGDAALATPARRLVVLSRMTGPVRVQVEWTAPEDLEAVAAGLHIGRQVSFTVSSDVPPDGVDLADLLSVSKRTVHLPSPQRGFAYAAGYAVVGAIVDRIGFAGLLSLCRSGRAETPEDHVGVAELLDAAGWQGRTLQDCLASAWTPALLREALSEPTMAHTIVRAVDAAFPDSGRRVVDGEVTVSFVFAADSEGREYRTTGVVLNLGGLSGSASR